MPTTDVISEEQAPTLAAIFRERVRRTPQAPAYIDYDSKSKQWQHFNWGDTAHQVARWQKALKGENLQPGDRVAIMLRNCCEWAIFDQAAQGLGLVVVPIYTNDRPDNIGYILQDAGVRLLLLENNRQWQSLLDIRDQLAGLTRIVTLQPVRDSNVLKPRVVQADDWLPAAGDELASEEGEPDSLATIVYTSGTTGRPKGVMLSHRNIISNVHGALQIIDIYPDDLLLSFLPLSHMFERTAGYYLPIITGASVAYSRSIPQLAEDLQQIRPTAMISVPRIFERVYSRIHENLRKESPRKRRLFQKSVDLGWQRFEYQQGRGQWSPGLLAQPLLDRLVGAKIRQRLGGRLRLTVCGGAALPETIARTFIGLGIPILQGYGLTECSPVLTANTLEDNIPASVGIALRDVELRIAEHEELLARGPNIMLGYWNNSEATENVIDSDGWLHTGDKGRIEDSGHVFITGRIKEIIVLANGEKVPPADMEMAITLDALFEQAIVIGEARPFLSALVVLEPENFRALAIEMNLDPQDPDVLKNRKLLNKLVKRIRKHLHSFPGYAKINRIGICTEPWTPENGLMTPTLKLRRHKIVEQHAALIDSLYEGHE